MPVDVEGGRRQGGGPDFAGWDARLFLDLAQAGTE
jgi:hypothetical protein